MKKLSFILAIFSIILVIACVAVVTSTTVSAASLTIPAGVTVVDENSTSAIGYVENGSNYIYVTSLTHAADIARANIGTQVVLHLTKNYTTNNRIGMKNASDSDRYDLIDLSGGADFVIDGLSRDGKTMYSMYSSNIRFIHFGDSIQTNGQMTFRNMTIGTTSTVEGSMQTNSGSLKKITLKNVVIDIPVPRPSAPAVVISTDAEFDGVTRDCNADDFIRVNGGGISLTVKNCTASEVRYTINGNGNTLKNIEVNNLNIESATEAIFYNFTADNINISALNVESTTGCVFYNLTTDNINISKSKVVSCQDVFHTVTTGNINISALNVESTTGCVFYKLTADKINIYSLNVASCDRLFDTVAADATIITADIRSRRANTNHYDGNIVICGGNYTTSEDCVIYFGYSQQPLGSTLTINGGTFTTKSSKHATVYQAFSGYEKVLTINGGTFNSWNKGSVLITETEFKKYDEKDTNGNILYNFLDKNSVSVLYSTADTFYVNGGTFNLYSDDGKTLVKQGENKGACVASRGGGFINIRGGTFNGGQYLYFWQNSMSAWANCNKAEMPTDNSAEIIIKTTKGASIRTASSTETSGIRFQGTISKDAIDFIYGLYKDSNVNYGILIVPEEYLTQANGVFTVKALKDAGCSWATKNATNKKENKDGTYTITLALTNIKASNIDKKFVAIAYLYSDGNATLNESDTHVIYAPEYSYARSVKETAQAALADVMLSSGKYNGRNYTTKTTVYCLRTDNGGYVNMTSGTRYSAFSQDQINVLKKYAGIS